jgi:DNA-binding transcriptional LysR family regulator
MSGIDLRRVDLNLLVLFEVLMAERSVTRAAERLGRTQSAVSHALARLREQLTDPLLVKSAGGMQPSPFALELVEQVRPILAGVQRVLSPRKAFDPSTSRRTFRVALPDLALTLFPALLALARKRAPQIALEWVTYQGSTLLDVVEERIEVALAPAALHMPDGIESEPIGALKWGCFGRRGHAAFARWGRTAWSRWPHVTVGIGDRVRNPVNVAAVDAGIERVVAARVPTFAAVAPLLARSDLLATLPAIVMADAARRFDLIAMPVPFRIDPMRHVLLWTARLSSDPEIAWLRGLVRTAIAEVFTASELIVH